MRHNHSISRTIRKEGIMVGECICHARKVLIEGVPTSWVEGYYRETGRTKVR